MWCVCVHARLCDVVCKTSPTGSSACLQVPEYDSQWADSLFHEAVYRATLPFSLQEQENRQKEVENKGGVELIIISGLDTYSAFLSGLWELDRLIDYTELVLYSMAESKDTLVIYELRIYKVRKNPAKQFPTSLFWNTIAFLLYFNSPLPHWCLCVALSFLWFNC